MIKNIFINPTEHRLRTGWRITIFIILFIVLAKVFNVIIKLLGGPPDDHFLSEILKSVFVVTLSTIVVLITRIFFDKRTVKSLGLSIKTRGISDLFIGFIISGLMISLIYLILSITGSVKIVNTGFENVLLNNSLTLFVWLILIGVAVAWFEELTFRGYLLQNLADGIGLRWAVVLTSLLFGFIHMANPNATLLSGIIITIITFILVLGWLRTGQLWISFGLHAGWNFFLGPVFGFPVSGLKEDSFLHLNISGSKFLTGGEFGPEGGFLVIPVIIIGIIILMFLTRRRKDTPWFQFKL